ncbi:MAG: glycosyltransferase family 4 protein [Candidatus Hydrogenedentes bacterium]|nr:glycosyltransferase family 4 protein [Candidatus Hydrogenedentota bacterium]
MSSQDGDTPQLRPVRRPMILGVDARAANAERRAGTGTYCCELLRALAPLCGVHTLRLYLDAPPRAGFPIGEGQAEFRILPPAWGWTQRALRAELRREPPDVFLAPTMQVPFGVPCLVAVTVHDLAFFDFGRYFTWGGRLRSIVQARYATRRADHIFAVSESARDELTRILRVPRERITVTPHGVSAAFSSAPDELAQCALPSTYALPERYILYVGRLQPRKNIERLINAFEILRRSHPDLPHDLVIAGDKGWLYDQIFLKAQASVFADRIHFLGFVPAELLPNLMQRADVFALVSLWEGFGIPVIEAMACGTAVVASNCSSLPEVAGDAAVLVDPYSVEAIAAGLAAVLTQEQFRADLSTRGRERARNFSWRTAAERTLEVLLRLAESSEAKY